MPQRTLGLIGLLDRRALLRLLAAAPGAVAFGAGCNGSSAAPAPPDSTGFLTADEKSTLGALANAILPPDDTPGGEALGAVAYVERLLTAFDVSPPAIFAGGPFSGRAPYADANGAPTTTFPPNDFAGFLPLDRYGDAAWRLTIFGSAGLPSGGPNDAALGPAVGLRDQLRSGLAAALQLAGGPLGELAPAALASTYKALDPALQSLLYNLVCEGAFAAPEYGGNAGLAGWKLANFEGDVMPFGYTQYDAATKAYVERADAPVSKANPGADPTPIAAETWDFVKLVVSFLGGKEFP